MHHLLVSFPVHFRSIWSIGKLIGMPQCRPYTWHNMQHTKYTCIPLHMFQRTSLSYGLFSHMQGSLQLLEVITSCKGQYEGSPLELDQTEKKYGATSSMHGSRSTQYNIHTGQSLISPASLSACLWGSYYVIGRPPPPKLMDWNQSMSYISGETTSIQRWSHNKYVCMSPEALYYIKHYIKVREKLQDKSK